MTGKRKKRGITPWKKTAFKVCVLWLIMAAAIHGFREWKVLSFDDQREASRWGASQSCAQVSAFLPSGGALKEENIQEVEYKINTNLAQDSIKLTAEGEDARLWQDCYSGIGSLTLAAGSKTVTVEAVGTGGAFFTFHPLNLSSGTYYLPDSQMKDEILLDQETAWKLFGSFNVEGRTVRVEDMYLRIAGVYKKGEGNLYKEGGLSDYVVFVQYKTLIQYGGSGAGSDSSEAAPGTASSPAANSPVLTALRGRAAEEAADTVSGDDSQEVSDISPEEDTESGDDAGDHGSQSTDSSDAGSLDPDQQSAESGQGATPDDNSAQSMENVGTSNTAYKDTGMITTYEVVMPNPVDGYAAGVVQKALGDESGAIVVDNTNRYEIPNLVKDLRNFALLGMRTQSVRYPYWENVAMGWELIFAALFLLECILIALTVLLLLYMLIHWYRHKTWTVAGTFNSLQDSVYERQSRKKYPEYYKEKEEEKSGEERTSENKRPAQGDNDSPKAGNKKETGKLEDKGLTPFEKIPENRKAVQYETNHQDDQHGAGGSAGSDPDGMRRGQQQ